MDNSNKLDVKHFDVYKEAINKAEQQLANCLETTDNRPSQCRQITKFIVDVQTARFMNAFYRNGIGF